MLHLIACTARDVAVRVAPPGVRYHLESPIDWQLTAREGGFAGRSGRCEHVVLMLHDLEPATDFVFEAGTSRLEFRTPECGGQVVVDELIAGDEEAAAENARILAHRIERLPRNGAILLPEGRYFARPVALRSDMTFRFSKGAVLSAPSSRAGWPILPARDVSGAMLGSWEGLPAACFAAPMHAIGAHNVVIAGPGMLDGGGDRGDWWAWAKETRDGARRPRGLHLVNCTAVRLLGFSIRNAPSWTIHPQGCRDLVAAGLHIMAPAVSPNTDGFDPEMCEDVTLEGIRFSVGDDCIAIKAGKRADDGADDHLRPTCRIAIRHCLMERGHGGVVIGSEMSGDVEDVQVSGCEMIGTDRGLRLKTRRGRGGAIRNVLFENVRMERVATAISANAHYYCDADGKSDYVQNRTALPKGRGTPLIEGIVVRNVELHGLANAACVLLGLPEAPIRGVLIDDLRVESFDADAIETEPVMACGIRPMRHEGIVTEHAEFEVRALKGVSRSERSVSLPEGDSCDSGESGDGSDNTNSTTGVAGDVAKALAYFDGFCRDYQHYKGGAWCYEDGCIYRGLVLLHRATGEARWLDHLRRLTEPQIAADGTLARYAPDEFNIDNILAGRSLFHLATTTGDGRYMKAAAVQAGQLEHHPRIATGNYWHKRTYPDQVWLDGLYMGLPFQIEYGLATAQPALVEDAIAQFLSALELTAFDRFYAHGYDHARRQRWADPKTGRSPAVWARAVGWLSMALVDTFELTRDVRLAAPTAALLRELVAEQHDDGLWPQVLDAPDLDGNYEESSASAMFASALLAATRLGLGDYASAGRRGLAALVRDRLKTGDDGRAHFTTICHVAGLGSYGGGPYRSGTREYYLEEKVVSDDAKGVGPLMMAVAEAFCG